MSRASSSEENATLCLMYVKYEGNKNREIYHSTYILSGLLVRGVAFIVTSRDMSRHGNENPNPIIRYGTSNSLFHPTSPV